MVAAKNHVFTEQEIELAAFAKALAHPARVAIVQLLLQRDACVCGDIVDKLPLAQSTVSQHLKELKLAGLVRGTVDGPRMCYCLDSANWQRARTLLLGLAEAGSNSRTC